jgi:hypothetical protein
LDIDAPPKSFKYSNVNPKVKTMEEGIGVRSLVCSILGVKKVCWNFKMGMKMNDRRVNYSHGPT